MPERFINYDLTKVWTSADTDTPMLGEKFTDGTTGNEYIFLTGVASTAVGDMVTFDAVTFLSTRMTKAEVDKLKPLAVAIAAVGASQKGWYGIAGKFSVTGLTLCAKEVAIYTSATAGAVDDDSTSQTKINRMINLTVIGGATAVSPMWIQYPSAA